MVSIVCRTNLDDVGRYETFPTELPECPKIGHLIRSARKRRDAIVELEVCQVTWIHSEIQKHWYAEVYLDLPRHRFENISAFQNWYNKIKFSS